MASKKFFTGLEGFVWFVGVVEDRQDPEQMGRVRVRCFGWHTEDKSKIPTDSLPWAHTVIPVNNPTAYAPKEGDMVMGFFMDGTAAQNPVILGTFPGKPEKKPDYNVGFSDQGNAAGRPKKPDDPAEKYPKSKYLKESTTNRLSRGKTDSTVIATRKKNLKKGIKSTGGVSWNEPNPAFAPKYPYNNAMESESGHALEFDDTPGQERVHLAHRKGTFIEIDKDGNQVEKVVKDNYSLIMGSDYVYVAGKCSITVDGDCNLQVGGNMNIGATGDVRIKGKAIFIESTSTTDVKIGGEGKITSGGKLNLKGATAALQGAVIDLPAAQINMQSGSASSASGTGLTGGGAAPTEVEEAAATAATQESANTVAAAAASAAGGGAGATSVVGAVSSTVSGAVGGLSGAVSGITGAVSGITGAVGEIAGTVSSTIGKVVGGVTSTVSNVFSTVNNAADNVLSGFTNKLPIGELSAKVSSFESLVNGSKGSILSLKPDLQTTLTNKIGEISVQSALNNIDFNVDQALLPVSEKATTVETVIGKRVYPFTQTIQREKGE